MRAPRRHWLAEAGFAVALLAYPRAFRRHFGDEMREDFRRAPSSAPSTVATLRAMLANGLAERSAAVTRWSAYPTSTPHLYEPRRRQSMFWDALETDLRHTVRQAVRAPLFTGLAILALALGIGANSAVFTVVNSVLLRPLPYHEPERLAIVWSDNRNEGRAQNVVSPANFADYRERNRSFERMDYALSFLVRLFARGDETGGPIWALRTGTAMFDVLGRKAMLGRTYVDGDRDVAVVSHAFWMNRLGGDPAAIGQSVTLSGNETVTVIGVMPPDFAFPYRSMFGPWDSGGPATADVWMPMPFEGSRWQTPGGSLVRSTHLLMTVGRLRPGVTPTQAQDDVASVARALEQEYPDTNRGWGATVVPLTDQTLGDVRPALVLVLAGVALLLLMAAVNVANLVLARGVARQREFAVRAAVGAGPGRLVRQALTESIVLALAGAAVGLLCVRWLVRALVALAPAEIPRVWEVSPDWRVVVLTMAVAVATGVAVGLLPALSAARDDVRSPLQDQSRGAVGSRSRRRLRSALVVVEMALAVVLTIGAGLLIRSFVQVVTVETGIAPGSLLTFQMNVPDRLTTPEARRAFYETWMDRLAALPGVTAVGGTTRIPLGSGSVTTSLHVEGRAVEGQPPEVEFRRVMRDYFRAMGIPLIRGRLFGREDGPGGSTSVIVNQTLARRIFGSDDAVGRHVQTGASPSGPWMTIVGVVGDVRHRGLEVDPLPELYLSYESNPPNSPFLAVRTTGDAAALAGAVRSEARALDATMPVYSLRTLDTLRDESVAERRFLLILIAGFGLLALVLAGVGIYGVMTLVAAERQGEAGVRLALGARPGQILRLILSAGMRLAAAGAVAGASIAAVLAPLVEAQLFGIRARDPLTFVLVPSLLVAIAALATLVPARRAMRADPLTALRAE